MRKLLSAALLLCTVAFLQGCAVWGTIQDERLVDTMSSDKSITTLIKNDLLAERFSDGWNIDVYSYYGHVFLVGEAPQNMREKAVAIARKDRRVRSVTTHWFTAQKGDSDFMLATKLRTALIGTKGLSSTRIDTEVNANRVVLLGVVQDASEKALAIRSARETKGVKSVTSYLMLPPKPGEPDACPVAESYGGISPAASSGGGSSSGNRAGGGHSGEVPSHDI